MFIGQSGESSKGTLRGHVGVCETVFRLLLTYEFSHLCYIIPNEKKKHFLD
jgi:hypothetical protein